MANMTASRRSHPHSGELPLIFRRGRTRPLDLAKLSPQTRQALKSKLTAQTQISKPKLATPTQSHRLNQNSKSNPKTKTLTHCSNSDIKVTITYETESRFVISSGHDPAPPMRAIQRAAIYIESSYLIL